MAELCGDGRRETMVKVMSSGLGVSWGIALVTRCCEKNT